MALGLDPKPAIVQLHRCLYVSCCRARLPHQGDTIARKLDKAGRLIRLIELCDRHAEVVAEHERDRGLEVEDQLIVASG